MAEAKFHIAAAVVSALLLSTFLQSVEVEDYESEERSKGATIIDKKLKALVEAFRANMTQPIDSFQLPTLDPFHLDSLPINLNLNGIKASGVLKDLDVTGLSDFVLDRIHLLLVGLTIQFRFFLAQLTASTKLNISVADKLHLSGDNPYSLDGEDLVLSGEISLSSYETGKINLYLKKVTFDFSYKSLTVDLPYDFNANDKLTAAVKAVVNDLLPQILDREKSKLLNWAQTKVTDLGDHLLENTTWADILNNIM